MTMTEPKIASIKDYCSMPHDRVIVTPIFLSLIAMGVSLRSMSRCDLFVAQWGMDCGDDGSCEYTTSLAFGVLFRETVVRVLHNGLPIREHRCQLYTESDEWMLGNVTWSLSRILSFCSIIIAALSSMFLCTTFCVAYRSIFIRCFSFGYFIAGISNLGTLAPMFSEICRSQEGQCDPSGFNCVNTCSFNRSAWFQIACSVSYITCWLLCSSIPRHLEEKKSTERKTKKLYIHDDIELKSRMDRCERTSSTKSTDSESTDSSIEMCTPNTRSTKRTSPKVQLKETFGIYTKMQTTAISPIRQNYFKHESADSSIEMCTPNTRLTKRSSPKFQLKETFGTDTKMQTAFTSPTRQNYFKNDSSDSSIEMCSPNTCLTKRCSPKFQRKETFRIDTKIQTIIISPTRQNYFKNEERDDVESGNFGAR